MVDPYADDYDYEVLPPPKPTAPSERPKPLPRLWKTETGPEGTSVDPPGSPPRAAGAPQSPPVPSDPKGPVKRPAAPPIERGDTPVRPRRETPEPRERPRPRPEPTERDQPRRKVLVEETPEYDTYEARNRVRGIATGVILTAAVVGILVLVLPNLKFGEESFDDLPDEGALASKASKKAGAAKPDTSEADAAKLLTEARKSARAGRTEAAVASLKKITTTFGATSSARAAREALDRPNQNPPLPLFLDDDGSTVVASGVKRPTLDGSTGEAPTITAVDAAALRPGTATTGDASLVRPKAAAEAGAPPPPAGGETAREVEVRPLPAGFSIREGSGVHPSGWPLQITGDRDGAPMIFIPPGTFRMGRDDGPTDEGPAHVVNLSGYYIDLHEVTNRQFELYVKETGRRPVGAAAPDPATAGKTAELPVVNVSARDALAFCEWAGKRLPTEAQWEKAARTTDGRLYPWGGAEPTWVRPRQTKQIDPIMTYELDQSPYGVYDMAGNAWEWTADYFEPTYYQQFRDTTALNPAGPAPKTRSAPVVLKGGSRTFHVAWREGLKPETRYPFVGFRGVLTLDGADPAPAVVETPAKPVPAGGSPAARKKAGVRPQPGGVVPF